MNRTLRLYTDFVCPFCFVAERSVVGRLVRERDLTLEWCGFELHPGTPRGGMPLSQLFPGVHVPSLHERTRRFAESFGVLDLHPPDRVQNTRRILAVAELAREKGVLDAFRSAALDAHWLEGKDLEADATLEDLARRATLDPNQALDASDSPLYQRRVDERQAEARSQGITSIPTFVIGDRRIVGCQPYEVVASAFES